MRCARLAAVGLLTLGLSGCQSIQPSTSDGALIRFIHASPDSPALDIYQNSGAVAYNLSFGTITSYVPLSSGSSTFAANAAGSHQAMVAARLPLTVGHQYTAIIGNVAAGLQETVLTDQTSPAPGGQISLRFVDQATRAGAVDIYLVPSSGKLLTSTPVATDIAFSTNTGYLNIPAGTYALAVVPTGTVPISTTLTLLTGPQVAYASGSVRTVVLIDPQAAITPAVQAVVADDYDPPAATS